MKKNKKQDDKQCGTYLHFLVTELPFVNLVDASVAVLAKGRKSNLVFDFFRRVDAKRKYDRHRFVAFELKSAR